MKKQAASFCMRVRGGWGWQQEPSTGFKTLLQQTFIRIMALCEQIKLFGYYLVSNLSHIRFSPVNTKDWHQNAFVLLATISQTLMQIIVFLQSVTATLKLSNFLD